MKILTANTAFGIRMDSLWRHLRGHLAFHGAGAIAYLFFPPAHKLFPVAEAYSRARYLRAHSSISAILTLIEEENPDILVLNELIYELMHDPLKEALRQLGYTSFAWGKSEHHEDAHVSTLVAAKESGEAFPCTMPQNPYMGGGGGIAGLRLGSGVSVIGAHLVNGQSIWKAQVEAIADQAQKEIDSGNKVILAGDWNHNERAINEVESFRALGLKSVEKKESGTCPSFFLWRFALDHIFISETWKSARANTLAFGSDHLALSAEIE